MIITTGEIIHGTNRPEDLIPAFADELERILNRTIGTNEEARKLVAEANGWQPNENIPSDDDGEDTADFIGELIDTINGFAPAFMSFGSNEGDGSSYGWWPDIDAAQDSSEVLVLGPKDERPGYLLEINDRGNATLWEVALKEVWSVV